MLHIEAVYEDFGDEVVVSESVPDVFNGVEVIVELIFDHVPLVIENVLHNEAQECVIVENKGLLIILFENSDGFGVRSRLRVKGFKETSVVAIIDSKVKFLTSCVSTTI